MAALTSILDLNEIPDLRIAAEDDAVLDAIWRRSTSRDCRLFREWFHANVRAAPSRVLLDYVRSLDLPPPSKSPTVKAMRVACITLAPMAAGALFPEAGSVLSTAGTVAGLLDSLVLDRVVDRFRRTPSPKLIVDDLRAAFGERA